MNFDFLTPEIFDMLVITNLIVALILIAFRFYQDMTHKQSDPQQQRVQAHDESSHAALSDTDVSSSEILSDTGHKQQSDTQ